VEKLTGSSIQGAIVESSFGETTMSCWSATPLSSTTSCPRRTLTVDVLLAIVCLAAHAQRAGVVGGRGRDGVQTAHRVPLPHSDFNLALWGLAESQNSS
jgi:hypothetical protein